MPSTDIRPHVVALLCHSDFKLRSDSNTWTHSSGRPFTEEEQATALSATKAEFEEFGAQHQCYMEYLRTKEESPDTLQRFLAPFMERVTEKTLGNAVELMSKDDRAELDRILGLIVEPTRPFTPYAF
ncbi:hypothetical protein [Streptomyces sp. VRA16 Mangrove soil]|uniref:hypothetical protein n=1 Tax=Streptomyces sp. VRA16 Mangrove soil TaxID=2817434 RepID=UPI001A9EAE1D|nr:hypothetical protein [Streptomyces sp. VRA16 Mangrove soil]MBO1333745.1 hypothetical protein [Streptomyces sp. VRA16 Mangrove soil]